ncbi:hypothetical protein GALL_380480 [mine drainage metagenome]|uniref:Uncharacterized protein n=1 Tax=mine drainage metagenome TaxID=410659 RepID=A0A1J5Q956_9ZZZZ
MRLPAQIVDAPGHALRLQVDGQLGIVGGGETVQVARLLEDVGHVGHVRRGAQGLAQRMAFGHELGVFDGIEGAAAADQLHGRLQLRIALAGLHALPQAGACIAPFEQHGLGAGARRARQALQQALAGHGVVEQETDDRIDQRVDARSRRTQPRRLGGVEAGFDARWRILEFGLALAVLPEVAGVAFGRRRSAFLARMATTQLPGLPEVECGHGGDDQRPHHQQGLLQLTHRISSSFVFVGDLARRRGKASSRASANPERVLRPPLRPGVPRCPCPPRRCVKRPVPAWSHPPAARPFPSQSYCAR